MALLDGGLIFDALDGVPLNLSHLFLFELALHSILDRGWLLRWVPISEVVALFLLLHACLILDELDHFFILGGGLPAYELGLVFGLGILAATAHHAVVLAGVPWAIAVSSPRCLIVVVYDLSLSGYRLSTSTFEHAEFSAALVLRLFIGLLVTLLRTIKLAVARLQAALSMLRFECSPCGIIAPWFDLFLRWLLFYDHKLAKFARMLCSSLSSSSWLTVHTSFLSIPAVSILKFVCTFKWGVWKWWAKFSWLAGLPTEFHRQFRALSHAI